MDFFIKILQHIEDFFSRENFTSLSTFILTIVTFYYLLKFFKGKNDFSLGYKLFLAGMMPPIISSLFYLIYSNSLAPTSFSKGNLTIYFIFWVGLLPLMKYFLLYGIIALIIEKTERKWFKISLLKMFFFNLFSLGAYLPIWMIQKYKEYKIEAKYHIYLIIYIFGLGSYYTFLHSYMRYDRHNEYFDKDFLFVSAFYLLFFAIWNLFMIFFLQAQIQKNSKVILFNKWYLSLLFGFFYIQYHINDEQQNEKKQEQLYNKIENENT